MSAPNQEVPNIEGGLNEEVLHVHETDSSDHEVEVPEIDYSSFEKKDFAKLLKDLSQEPDIRKADKQVRLLKPALVELREQAREVALNRFLADGGKSEDFSIRKDDDDLVIDGAIRLIREKRVNFIREQEASRKFNLTKKEELLARLREVVEVENATGSFQDFKKIQEEWRAIGPVPQTFNKDIWASYHALVDRFFDHRHIYLELLDLDRRKNLEIKKEICFRAERLSSDPSGKLSLSAMLKEINELHNEWKHVGPVPKDEKESIWSRFKAASDRVYQKRDSYVKEITGKLKLNRASKQAILEKVSSFGDFDSNSVKDWNQKSKEAAEAQDAWTKVGPVERSKAKDLNRQFWSSIKSFYLRKGQFFKKLDAGRQENLDKKRALIDQVVSLKQSEDLTAAIEQVKQIQADWKSIGPVPDKISNKLFAEFKGACDYFFERRRESNQETVKAQEENLKVKFEIAQSLELLSGSESVNQAKELIARFQSVGQVPRKNLDAVRDLFQKSIQTFLSTLPSENDFKDKVALELELVVAQNDPQAGKRIYQQEQSIRKKLFLAENELAVLKNNLEFFARSKNADSVRADFQNKISAAEADVMSLKNRLKLIRSMPVN